MSLVTSFQDLPVDFLGFSDFLRHVGDNIILRKKTFTLIKHLKVLFRLLAFYPKSFITDERNYIEIVLMIDEKGVGLSPLPTLRLLTPP
jgi:hypothetical protein